MTTKRMRPYWALLVVLMAALVALVACINTSATDEVIYAKQQETTACLMADNVQVSPITEVQGDVILPVPAVPAMSIALINNPFKTNGQALPAASPEPAAFNPREAHSDAILPNLVRAKNGLLNINQQTGARLTEEVCYGAELATTTVLLA